uniref:Homeobox domain-containing protein n=1 Tax=Megaselia scalaris TaxID=36166 RepID=T1GB60_MEGSC
VVKHWFRNTLFKERQRNKDSPYNFANPPSTTLNLEEYERTGQTSLQNAEKSSSTLDDQRGSSNSLIQPEYSISTSAEQEPENSSSSLDNMQIKVESIENELPANSSETENRSESESSERDVISRPQTPGLVELIGQDNLHQMGPPKKFQGSNSSLNSPAGGKRANRTRFTDYQIKVLQEFFENNSYPKDSDLEYLNASPRERTPSPQPQQNVIPSQNLIQQSNTPNSSISSSQDFYESPLSSPTTIETTISVVESGQGHQNQQQPLQPQLHNNHKRLRTTILPDQLNLLYECYQTESNPSRKMLEEISKKVNLKKRVVQVWFQNARAKDKKSRNNRLIDECNVNQNSNLTSSTPPTNMALVRELMTKDKCMVNGVFNHFFLNVPLTSTANSSEEDLEEENVKIEDTSKATNSSSLYPYYNNYGLNPDTLEPPFTLDMNPGNIFTCLICENFHTNSLDDLNNHILSDRSRPQTPTSDIMLVVNNNYICRL